MVNKKSVPNTPPRPLGVGQKAKYDHARKLWTFGEYYFDEISAQKAVEFFPKYIKFTKAKWAGKPFQLELWQERDIIRPLFGWKRADGTRRFRRCFVWVPRKNGKTELAAGIALLLLLGDAEFGAEIYSIATDKDQAKIVFEKASVMVNLSSTLQKDLELLSTAIYCPAINGSFKPLSGTASGKHGLSMSGLIGDEVHEWKHDELYQFVHDSIGSREQPLEFLISTAGLLGGVGEQFWKECLNILEGVIVDDETLVVVYGADEKDDWTLESTWYKANPNLTVSKNLRAMRADAKRAAMSPRLENSFKCYHLNIWSEQSVRWLPIDSIDDRGKRYGWNYCAGKTSWRKFPKKLRGKYCYAGIDLSSIADLTSIVYWFPIQAGLKKPKCIARFFKPADLIKAHSKRDFLPYDLWVKSGALIETPGNVIDYNFVQKTLYRDAERFDIQNIGVDKFNATQFSIDVAQNGMKIEFFGQGFVSMNSASKELERLVISSGFDHGGHPILSRHAKVVTVMTDAAGNIKPNKDKSIERIDGIVGLIEAIGMATSDSERGNRLTDKDIVDRGGLV